jgi:hypothetical protein
MTGPLSYKCMSGYKRFFCITLSLLTLTATAAPEARAADPLNGIIQTNIRSCKVYELVAGKFKPAPKAPLRAGLQLNGRLHATRSDIFLTRIGAATYAIPTSCVSTTSAIPDTPRKAAKPGVATDAAKPDAKNAFLSQLEPRFRFLFYQDTPVVTDPTVGQYETVGHVSAICPGAAYHRALSPLFDFVADVCVILGTSDTRGVGSNELLDVSYEYDHAFTFGARFVPGVEMPFANRDFRIGLGLPFVFQAVSWGSTASGASASSGGLKFPGALLTIQGTRDKFGFIADFGFLKKPTRTMYSFGVSYQF